MRPALEKYATMVPATGVEINHEGTAEPTPQGLYAQDVLVLPSTQIHIERSRMVGRGGRNHEL